MIGEHRELAGEITQFFAADKPRAPWLFVANISRLASDTRCAIYTAN
jgi:hypothetical protein